MPHLLFFLTTRVIMNKGRSRETTWTHAKNGGYKTMRIIGIDTGGTCTDAVLYDTKTRETISAGKAQTTRTNLEVGIMNALDTLAADQLKTAQMVALSTTLATNAALENKGSRARMLLIGFDEKMMDHLKDTYASYGLTDRSQFVIIDAKAEGAYSNPYDPDWEDLRARAGEYFDECDSVGIVQMNPTGNGGRFELTALKILQEELDKPLTIAYDISNETDILKTCAGTLLNARLIPLTRDLMTAVRRTLNARGLDIPVSIVRSDGTIMSEDMAMLHPVETLMSGPAASAVGGCALAGVEDGIIVDMGGTTTDIVAVHRGVPESAENGIRIGQWKTMVKGISVDTFGLGGDSAVRYKDNELFLDTERVIPVSVLAAQYENVVPALNDLADRKYYSACWMHEFYVLQKSIEGKSGYTKREQQICDLLKYGPMITMELADRIGTYPRFLDTRRLEAEGIIMKSGLTPTDIMILKGDFTLYEKAAAEAALRCLWANISMPLEEVPDHIYELVVRRMYSDIGKVLLSKQYPKAKKMGETGYIDELLDSFYEQAKEQVDGSNEAVKKPVMAQMQLTSPDPLIGVGAPIHVFLPRVAQLLHTQAILPQHEDVANAIGAAVSRRVASSSLTIKAEYDGALFSCLSLYEDGERHTFKKTPDAIAFGKEVLERKVRKKAVLQGIEGEPYISMDVEEKRIGHVKEGTLLEVHLRAEAVQL